MDPTPAPRRIHNSSSVKTAACNPRAQTRVAAYCRVSTDSELQEGSFEMQQCYYHELISRTPGMVLVDVYGDKGKTGRSITARPALQRMIADCEAGKIDLILTKSISRFARNMADCAEMLRKLKQLGIPVIFEKEGLNSMDAQRQVVLDIFAALAQEESNSISLNCRWTIEQHNASGKPHFKPSYGYTKARGDWVWHIREDEAKRVRLAFRLAAEGYSITSIRHALDALEKQEGSEVRWLPRRVRYLLTNINYTGSCLTNKTLAVTGRKSKAPRGENAQYLIEGHHEPLVSRSIYMKVQTLLASGQLTPPENQYTVRHADVELL